MSLRVLRISLVAMALGVAFGATIYPALLKMEGHDLATYQTQRSLRRSNLYTAEQRTR